MITGNITISSKPTCDELTSGICAFCLEESEEVPIDISFSDQFGQVEDWSAGSACCGSEIVKGKIFLDKTSCHIANKDHVDENGKAIVKKGQRYKYRIVKGYYIDDGIRYGILKITKKVI